MHGRRDWMELDERKEKILKAIIQNYLETGEPVGQNDLQVFRFETQFGDDSK